MTDRICQVFFSPKSLEKAQQAFKDIIDTAASSQGVHPKLAKILKRTLHDVEKVGGTIGREKRRKTMPLTYKDGDSITMYMD